MIIGQQRVLKKVSSFLQQAIIRNTYHHYFCFSVWWEMQGRERFNQ